MQFYARGKPINLKNLFIILVKENFFVIMKKKGFGYES